MPKELIWKINREIPKNTKWSHFWNYALYNEAKKEYKTVQAGGIGVWKEDEDGYAVSVFDYSDQEVYGSKPMTYAEAMKEVKAVRDKVNSIDEMDRLLSFWDIDSF